VVEGASGARAAGEWGGRVNTAPTPRDIVAFALRVIFWSAAFLALWYAAARPVSMLAAWGAACLVEAVAPVERARPVWQNGGVVFEVEMDSTTAYRNRMRAGTVLEVPADPRKQTYGLAFFLALLFASRPRRVALKALGGAAVLAVLSAIGVASEVALQLDALPGPSGSPLIEAGAVARNLAALGFQLGTLIFPTVGPVMLWVAMDTRLVRRLGVGPKAPPDEAAA
jgi:hypothetical protein